MMDKSAIFSPDRVYRYSLTRMWNIAKPFVVFVGLNPSTADENVDDSTIRRCLRYAGDWGYGGLVMVNIFGYRSTDPKKLKQVKDPVGAENDFHIRLNSKLAELTIAAWGCYGRLFNRGAEVWPQLTNPHCLALTADGSPRHPLYLRKDLKPKPFGQP